MAVAGRTQSCLNIRDAGGLVSRVDGDDGLPLTNITSVAATTSPTGTRQLWLGTAHGAVLWQPADLQLPWRYFHGPRWLAGSAIRSVAVVGDAAVLVSEGGVTWLQQVTHECVRTTTRIARQLTR